MWIECSELILNKALMYIRWYSTDVYWAKVVYSVSGKHTVGGPDYGTLQCVLTNVTFREPQELTLVSAVSIY